MKRLIRYFLQGLLYLAPTAITLALVYLIFTRVDSGMRDLIGKFFNIDIPGIGVLALFVIITLLGFIGQSIIFRPLRRLVDNIMAKAPFVKLIYSSIKDLMSAFVGTERKFDKPVLVKVNLISDLEKMGFLTQSDLSELNIKDKVAVYFPHSYNFSGEMFIVPAEHVTPLDIPPAEAMKFIVSGGVTKVWLNNQKSS
ncbi:MAG: DUF502 domain-containing protein [Bacteroidales bacterium]|nr:DUF502 domain-containing protein [Bacteroidales bacterium]